MLNCVLGRLQNLPSADARSLAQHTLSHNTLTPK